MHWHSGTHRYPGMIIATRIVRAAIQSPNCWWLVLGQRQEDRHRLGHTGEVLRNTPARSHRNGYSFLTNFSLPTSPALLSSAASSRFLPTYKNNQSPSPASLHPFPRPTHDTSARNRTNATARASESVGETERGGGARGRRPWRRWRPWTTGGHCGDSTATVASG